MKQIKLGRVPSAMGFFVSIIVIFFGIFWTITAASMGAPEIFPLFGIIFILTGIGIAIYYFKNAFGKNRFSEYDIVDSNEERTSKFGEKLTEISGNLNYCPYCGIEIKEEFSFCPKCGKKIEE